MSGGKRLKAGLLIAAIVLILLAIVLVTYNRNVVTGAHSSGSRTEIAGDKPSDANLPPLGSITGADVAEPENSDS